MILAAVVLSFSTAAGPDPDFIQTILKPPTMSISAVRQIDCGNWAGSGFLIGDKIMVTANHVMEGGEGCVDRETKTPLTVYKTDEAHDIVLVTGPKLPTNIPYIKISCSGFETGREYFAYGWSSFRQSTSILRNDRIIATPSYTPVDFKWNDGDPAPGMRIFNQYQVPGLSGGPVVNSWGYAPGLVTGGSDKLAYNYEFKDTFLCRKD